MVDAAHRLQVSAGRLSVDTLEKQILKGLVRRSSQHFFGFIKILEPKNLPKAQAKRGGFIQAVSLDLTEKRLRRQKIAE